MDPRRQLAYYARADKSADQPRVFREEDIANFRTESRLCQTAQSNNSTTLFVPEDKPLNLKSRKVIIQDNYGTNEDHWSWHLDDGDDFIPESQDSRGQSRRQDVARGGIETQPVIPFISLPKEKQQLVKPSISLPKEKQESAIPFISLPKEEQQLAIPSISLPKEKQELAIPSIPSTPFAATQSTSHIPINSTSEDVRISPKTVENRLNIQGNTKMRTFRFINSENPSKKILNLL